MPMAHHRLTKPWQHSRALPLAVIVVMMTLLGCGLGDWDRPVGKHGYWLRDPSGGVILTGPKGDLVIPDMSNIWRAIEDDDWLLLEIGNADQSRTIGPRWMVVDMAARRDTIYLTEQEARAALPTRLRDAPLRTPRPGGLVGAMGDAFVASCVVFVVALLGIPAGLIMWWIRRRKHARPLPDSENF
jgi:hypothetical protein